MSTTSLVLVVTQDRDIRAAVQEVLDGCIGVRVLLARDSDHALKLLQFVKFALVMVEIVPPECNELNVVVQVNGQGSAKRTPVIAISNSSAAARQAGNAGASECLVKPVGKDTLLEVVRKYLPRL